MPETDLLPLVSCENTEASSSNQNPEQVDLKPGKFQLPQSLQIFLNLSESHENSFSLSDVNHALLKKASQMWGSLPAPPAFASEYPIKDGALQLNSAAHSSSSVHVTAGMIRIRNLTLRSSRIEWSIGKNGELNIVLSFGVSQDHVTLTPASADTHGLLSNKMPPILSWCWVLLVVLWILVLSVSPKIGASIYSR